MEAVHRHACESRRLRLVVAAAVLTAVPLTTGCSASDAVAEQTKGCSGPTPYALGATVTGRTGEGDCVGVDNSAGQLYSFQVAEPTAMAVTAVTSGFPGYVAVTRTDNRAIAQTNANEQGADMTVRAFVPAGTYRIFVAKMDNKDGAFTLSSGPGELEGCEANRSSGVLRGAVITGAISDTDCPGTSTRYDSYILSADAGEQVTLHLSAARLTSMEVSAEGGSVVGQRVVQPNGSATLTFTSPTTRRYFVGLVAFFNAQQPLQLPYSYTLRVE